MSARHTSGPWSIRQRPNAHGGFYIEPGIGEVLGNGLTPTANARLIAAAPDLLTAAKDFIEAERSGAWPRFNESREKLSAAIAKATEGGK